MTFRLRPELARRLEAMAAAYGTKGEFLRHVIETEWKGWKSASSK